MKKFLVFLCVATIFAVASCAKNEKGAAEGAEKSAAQPAMRVAMITDYGDITDQSFNQTTYEACKAFCEENKVEFRYYKPQGDATEARVASIQQAIGDDFNILVMPGFAFAEALVKTADDNDDVTFVALDVSEFDVMSAAQNEGKGANWTLPANSFCAVYDEHVSGYLAGYATVKEGYRHLGFLGGMAVPAVIRFGFGFVQGANQAAVEMGIANEVAVEYVYGGAFSGAPEITAAMDSWYSQRGVEVVFACGGGIFASACEAAAKYSGKVIGVDTDQSAKINSFGDGMCLTSAMKGLAATVNTLLDAANTGRWGEYSGKIASLGLVSGDDVEANYVQLPLDTWTMKNFSKDDYATLVSRIFNGELEISAATDVAPSVQIAFTQYPNIK